MQGREVELKFSGSADALRAAADHPLLAATGPSSPTLLTSTYFDTPDRDLRARGISLRVREGSGRTIQTLKHAAGSLVDRGEWEAEAEGATPSLDWIAGLPVGRAFRHGVGARLEPVFTVEVERRTVTLARGEALVEAALDRGAVRAGGVSRPLAELELELKRGAAADLFGLARDLLADVALLPSLAGKADRGFRLLDGAAGAAHPPAPGDGVAAAAEGIARACLRDLLANLDEVGERDDVEAVHRGRVALRRLRAMLALFEPALEGPGLAPVRAELKWMSDLLGAARDRDVLQLTVFDPAARTPEVLGGFELARHMAAKRADAHAALHAGLASRRWRMALLDLLAFVADGPWRAAGPAAEPVAAFVRPRLRKARKRVLRRGASLETASPHERHRLRIRAKTLRYQLAFFADAKGLGRGCKPYDALHDGLGTLQDALGRLHDRDALRDLLRAESFGWHGTEDAAGGRAPFAAGLLAGGAVDEAALVAEAAAAVRKIRKHDPF